MRSIGMAVTLLCFIPMALAEGYYEKQMPYAIGFSALLAISALAVAVGWI